MSWLVVHTKPRLESEALLQLQRQGYQAYLPQMRVESVRRGKFDERLIPLFPRYLFVRSPEDPRQSWGPIRYTRGVQRLVSFGHEPALMDESAASDGPALPASDRLHACTTARPMAGGRAWRR